MTVTIARATRSDESTLANLLSLYMHDFSEVFGNPPGPDGRYRYQRLPLYFSEEGRVPFLIRSGPSLAGLALVSRGSAVGGPSDVRDLSEFFVVRGLRRRGVGAAAASAVFAGFAGRWEVRALDRNPGAVAFWTRAVGDHTGGDFEVVPWTAESGDTWKIFRFVQPDSADGDRDRDGGERV